MKRSAGFGLIEIVIAASIVSMAVVSLSYVVVLSNRVLARSVDEIRANFIADEGIEVLHFLRDAGWDAKIGLLTPNVDYYISQSTTTGTWTISATNPGLLDGFFNRAIRVESVNRDANDTIVSTGGTLDPNSRKIVSTVFWKNGTTSVETYLSDIFNN
jgi:hypothetical protein